MDKLINICPAHVPFLCVLAGGHTFFNCNPICEVSKEMTKNTYRKMLVSRMMFGEVLGIRYD